MVCARVETGDRPARVAARIKHLHLSRQETRLVLVVRIDGPRWLRRAAWCRHMRRDGNGLPYDRGVWRHGHGRCRGREGRNYHRVLEEGRISGDRNDADRWRTSGALALVEPDRARSTPSRRAVAVRDAVFDR